MHTKSVGKNILLLTVPLSVLIIIASSYGITSPEVYVKETLNWQTQSRAQDIVDLFMVVPVLLSAAVFSFRRSKPAMFIWAGCILYLIYTFIIYCFSIHFNKLFFIYCMILGLSFYSMVYFSSSMFRITNIAFSEKNTLLKVTGIYFLIISSLFYFLWLSEIIPSSVSNIAPASLEEVGLFTNPVHVLDLSVVLPGIFMTGVFLLKRKQLGLLLAPVVLTFFILMDVTIGVLTYMMYKHELVVNPQIIWIMGTLTVFSTIILIKFFNKE